MLIENFDLSKKVFIIAELSANHASSLELALKSVKYAAKAGANAIKIQTYTPDSLTLNSTKKDFVIKGGLWNGQNLYELYKQALTPYSWHEKIFKAAKDEGLICFSTPFSLKDLEFLKQFNLPAYKIASFEANDLNFVKEVAKQNKPCFVSTGITTQKEITQIVKIFKEVKNDKLILLKCTSSYPSLLKDLNLNAISTLKKKFKCYVGLSDHSACSTAAILSVALGACAVEKHFVIDKSIKSPDSAFSLDFNEFKKLCQDIKNAQSALGSFSLELDKTGLKNRAFARSLYIKKDIKKGQTLSLENICSVRPNNGLDPNLLNKILGKKASKDLFFGDALKKGDFK